MLRVRATGLREPQSVQIAVVISLRLRVLLVLDDLDWTLSSLLDEHGPLGRHLLIMQGPEVIGLRTGRGGLSSVEIEILDRLRDLRWLAPLCVVLLTRRLPVELEFANVVASSAKH